LILPPEFLTNALGIESFKLLDGIVIEVRLFCGCDIGLYLLHFACSGNDGCDGWMLQYPFDTLLCQVSFGKDAPDFLQSFDAFFKRNPTESLTYIKSSGDGIITDVNGII